MKWSVKQIHNIHHFYESAMRAGRKNKETARSVQYARLFLSNAEPLTLPSIGV